MLRQATALSIVAILSSFAFVPHSTALVFDDSVITLSGSVTDAAGCTIPIVIRIDAYSFISWDAGGFFAGKPSPAGTHVPGAGTATGYNGC